jgi:hypothetical protein
VSEERNISSVAGRIFVAFLGIVMVWFGLLLLSSSLTYQSSGGNLLLAIALGAIGVALVALPLVTLISAVRGVIARRRAAPRR